MKTRVTSRAWVKGLAAVLLLGPLAFAIQACTELGEETFGVVTPEEFYQTDEEILAGLAPVYSQLRSLLWNYHNLSQVSSDETLVPTRGSDWFDGGRWLSIHRHTWDPGLTDLNGSWNDAFTGVARANALLQILEGGTGNEALVAELRMLRAFYYYTLLDLFGRVPIVGDDEFVVDAENPPANESRAALFSFIESELLAARDALPDTRDGGNFGRVTKGAANALLANLYVNAEIFRGTIAAGGIERGAPAWTEALAAAEAVINSGQYGLSSNWFDNFAVSNEASPEIVFLVAHLADAGLGMTFQMRPLHYNQLSPQPWNGFATLSSVYEKFDEDDARRDIFLIGQQTNFNTGEEVTNRQGEPLIFTPDINNIEDAAEGEGIRILKFPPDLDNVGGDAGNDYPFIRLSEMYLIKAEALNETSGPTQEAVDQLNMLRERVIDPATYVPLAPSDFTQETLRDFIFDERVRELTYEAKRRQDLVRAGRFTEAWQFKDVVSPHLAVFPIPQVQIDSNPNLTQNAGY